MHCRMFVLIMSGDQIMQDELTRAETKDKRKKERMCFYGRTGKIVVPG